MVIFQEPSAGDNFNSEHVLLPFNSYEQLIEGVAGSFTPKKSELQNLSGHVPTN